MQTTGTPTTINLHTDPVPLHVDDTGAILVGQSRVTIDVLLQYWRRGMNPDEIARGSAAATSSCPSAWETKSFVVS